MFHVILSIVLLFANLILIFDLKVFLSIANFEKEPIQFSISINIVHVLYFESIVEYK